MTVSSYPHSASSLLMVDLAAIDQDEHCSMSRWFAYHDAGKGIVPKESILPRAIEGKINEDLRALMEMHDISPDTIQGVVDDITSKLTPLDREDVALMELLYRRLGWFTAFALFVEPKLRKHFDSIPIDNEILYDRDPLHLITHPDRVLKDKATGELIYREYVILPKNVDRRKWLAQWQTNVRLHLGIAAAEQQMGRRVSYAQVMGLSSGYVSLMDKKLVHPYVYGYENTVTGEWSCGGYKSNTDKEWKLRPIWTYPYGLVKWVQQCGSEIVDTMFPISPAVEINESLLTSWVKGKLVRERTINCVKGGCNANLDFRTVQFPRKLSMCRPLIGPECAYINVCHDQKAALTPLKSGEFVLNLVGHVDEIIINAEVDGV